MPRHRRHPGPVRRQGLRRRRPVPIVLASAVAIAVAAGTLSYAPARGSPEAKAVPGIIRAESFASRSDVRFETTSDSGGGRHVTWLANGDWMRYDGVDLGQAGRLTTTIRVAAPTNARGTVELHADTQAGPLLASFTIKSTGGWQRWVSLTDRRDVAVAGVRTIFIVIRSNHHADFVNINWFSFRIRRAPPRAYATASTRP